MYSLFRLKPFQLRRLGPGCIIPTAEQVDLSPEVSVHLVQAQARVLGQQGSHPEARPSPSGRFPPPSGFLFFLINVV